MPDERYTVGQLHTLLTSFDSSRPGGAGLDSRLYAAIVEFLDFVQGDAMAEALRRGDPLGLSPEVAARLRHIMGDGYRA